MGDIILIYDTGKLYEIDKDQIYEPFPKKEETPDTESNPNPTLI